jgi:hypothetical protein
MYASNSHLIRLATDADTDSLTRLAEVTSQPPLVGRVLVAQVDGTTVAAISVDDGKTLADPECFIGYLVPCLRARAHALVAYEAEPSLPARMVAPLPESYRSHAAGQNEKRRPAGRTPSALRRWRRVRRAALAGSGASPAPGR